MTSCIIKFGLAFYLLYNYQGILLFYFFSLWNVFEQLTVGEQLKHQRYAKLVGTDLLIAWYAHEKLCGDILKNNGKHL